MLGKGVAELPAYPVAVAVFYARQHLVVEGFPDWLVVDLHPSEVLHVVEAHGQRYACLGPHAVRRLADGVMYAVEGLAEVLSAVCLRRFQGRVPLLEDHRLGESPLYLRRDEPLLVAVKFPCFQLVISN